MSEGASPGVRTYPRSNSQQINYAEFENEELDHDDNLNIEAQEETWSDWEQEDDESARPATHKPTTDRKKSGIKRKRVLVDVHNNTGTAITSPSQVENEYERQRLERIRSNQEKMKQLGLHQLATNFVSTAAAGDAQNQETHHRQARAPRPPKQRRPRGTTQPTRQSSRVRGEAASGIAIEDDHDRATSLAVATESRRLDSDILMELPEYFASINQDISTAIKVDGYYHGWVNEEISQMYDIPPNAEEAWVAGGGGAFSTKIDKKAIPAHLRAKRWSDARAFSSTQLTKNPNAYFYRHVAPHEQQAKGEWTQEEHELFLQVVREHGVGTKWGLFASHIPQRVGYQCSAYYREVIIPSGLVIDPRWQMTKSGKAKFSG